MHSCPSSFLLTLNQAAPRANLLFLYSMVFVNARLDHPWPSDLYRVHYWPYISNLLFIFIITVNSSFDCTRWLRGWISFSFIILFKDSEHGGANNLAIQNLDCVQEQVIIFNWKSNLVLQLFVDPFLA